MFSSRSHYIQHKLQWTSPALATQVQSMIYAVNIDAFTKFLLNKS